MNRYEFYELKSWMYLPVIFIGLLGNFASFLVYRTAPMRKSTVRSSWSLPSIQILPGRHTSAHPLPHRHSPSCPYNSHLRFSFPPIVVSLPRGPSLYIAYHCRQDQWQKYSLHMSFFAYSTRYVYPLCMMTKSCSLYLMVLITIERWIAVCRPLQVTFLKVGKSTSRLYIFQAKVLCTNRNTLKAGIFIIIFSIVFNFPRFFDYKIG